jgi:hypothetical protein
MYLNGGRVSNMLRYSLLLIWNALGSWEVSEPFRVSLEAPAEVLLQ